MATFQLFHEFKKYLGDGTIDLDTHTFKVMLSNTAPTVGTNTIKSDITEISAGNGYTAGGATLTSVTWAETGSGTGVWRWTSADFSWTASGGSIATFQYIVIYDDSVASPVKPLVGYWDYGSALSVTVGNSFASSIGANGIIELS